MIKYVCQNGQYVFCLAIDFWRDSGWKIYVNQHCMQIYFSIFQVKKGGLKYLLYAQHYSHISWSASIHFLWPPPPPPPLSPPPPDRRLKTNFSWEFSNWGASLLVHSFACKTQFMYFLTKQFEVIQSMTSNNLNNKYNCKHKITVFVGKVMSQLFHFFTYKCLSTPSKQFPSLPFKTQLILLKTFSKWKKGRVSVCGGRQEN